MSSVRWRCGERETVEVVGVEERREVAGTIALVTSEVARDDEVVDLYLEMKIIMNFSFLVKISLKYHRHYNEN